MLLQGELQEYSAVINLILCKIRSLQLGEIYAVFRFCASSHHGS